jgi:hypothetical protein
MEVSLVVLMVNKSYFIYIYIFQGLLFLGVAGEAVIQIFLLLLQLAIAPLNQHTNKKYII